MDREKARNRLSGCYVTVPTMLRDEDLAVDLEATRQHVRFLIDGGINESTGVILAVGAAGDFPVMSFDERLRVAEAIIEEADSRIAVVMGAQTTNTRELVELVRAAERLGAEYVQVSPPYYHMHTEEDFYEYAVAAAEAADIGIIVYNTFWTSQNVSLKMVERLCELPNLVGLKWAVPTANFMESEQVISRFADRLCIIDNQLRFVTSHILGARGIEVHICNYWPQWGVRLWKLLENHEYVDVQKELVRVAMPFYTLWKEMMQYTGGDGYLDKLCMELVGLPSSRCRPPTRDVRDKFRERARQMLIESGVPGILDAPAREGSARRAS